MLTPLPPTAIPITSTPTYPLIDLTCPAETSQKRVQRIVDAVNKMIEIVNRLLVDGCLTATRMSVKNQLANIKIMIEVTDDYLKDLHEILTATPQSERQDILKVIMDAVSITATLNERNRFIRQGLIYKQKEYADVQSHQLAGKSAAEQGKLVKHVEERFAIEEEKILAELEILENHNSLQRATQTLEHTRRLRDTLFTYFGNKHYDFPVIREFWKRIDHLLLISRGYYEAALLNPDSSKNHRSPYAVVPPSLVTEQSPGNTTAGLRQRFDMLRLRTRIETENIEQALQTYIPASEHAERRHQLELYSRQVRLYQQNLQAIEEIRTEMDNLNAVQTNTPMFRELQRITTYFQEDMQQAINTADEHMERLLTVMYDVITLTAHQGRAEDYRMIRQQLVELNNSIDINLVLPSINLFRDRINNTLAMIAQQISRLAQNAPQAAENIRRQLNVFTLMNTSVLHVLAGFMPLSDNSEELRQRKASLNNFELAYIENINFLNNLLKEIDTYQLQDNFALTNLFHYASEQLRAVKERITVLRSQLAEHLSHHSDVVPLPDFRGSSRLL